MILRVLRCFDQLVNSNLWRRNVWVTKTQVDNVVAFVTCLNLQVVDDGEDVRGQIGDASKFHRDKLVVKMQQSGTNCTGPLAQLCRFQHGVNPVAWGVQHGGKAFLNAWQQYVRILHDTPTDDHGVGV